MSNTLFLKIQYDMKNAMRAKDTETLGAIRLLLASIKQREIEERVRLDDNQIIAVIDKMLRQCNYSIEQYEKFNRKDLAEKELAEVATLKKYMPIALSETEIENIIYEAIIKTAASSVKDMRQVMAEIKSKVQRSSDIGKISTKVKNILEKQI